MTGMTSNNINQKYEGCIWYAFLIKKGDYYKEVRTHRQNS